eukprot:NODE_4919_length_253_cov_66.357843_g4248_i0.p2 GENE.NODE_4919_length_253_cov_66.357843_g4248_i0~~NODE_4919_length_253_cov_66.357843_g4248_i0.p2  ORF type:complete len:56 (-),score=11.00 NODE_4919_length_253_cov_66.357843_g4248_i0:85-231(-)
MQTKKKTADEVPRMDGMQERDELRWSMNGSTKAATGCTIMNVSASTRE